MSLVSGRSDCVLMLPVCTFPFCLFLLSEQFSLVSLWVVAVCTPFKRFRTFRFLSLSFSLSQGHRSRFWRTLPSVWLQFSPFFLLSFLRQRIYRLLLMSEWRLILIYLWCHCPRFLSHFPTVSNLWTNSKSFQRKWIICSLNFFKTIGIWSAASSIKGPLKSLKSGCLRA